MASSSLRSNLLFARSFFKNPRLLGSFIPSSRFLARALMRRIRWDRTRVIVEYGPGVGTLTRPILRHLRQDGVLIAIERNTEFVSYLRGNIDDSRLHVFEGSAEDVSRVLRQLDLPHADCIISGIPYSTMPAEIREKILKSSRQILAPGGTFLVYQFTTAVAPHMRRFFGPVKQEIELRNILPARIFSAQKH